MIKPIEKLQNNLIGKTLDFLELDEIMYDTDNHYKIHFDVVCEANDNEVLGATAIKVTDITII